LGRRASPFRRLLFVIFFMPAPRAGVASGDGFAVTAAIRIDGIRRTHYKHA
jgi:hypothetical protein